MSTLTTFDHRPLRDPAAGRARRRRRWKSLLFPDWTGYVFGFLMVTAILVGVPAFVYRESTGTSRFEQLLPDDDVLLAIGVACVAALVGSMVALAVIGWPRAIRSVASRLPAFAAANGLEYAERTPDPAFPGMLFGVGTGRALLRHVWSTADPAFHVCTFRSYIPNGRFLIERRRGYAGVHLGFRMPHLVLEARRHRGHYDGGLPTTIAPDQARALPDGFDETFTLYAHEDATPGDVAIFSPALLRLLADDATGHLHAEVIDDWFFVYSPHSLEEASVEEYERAFRVVELVRAEALRRRRFAPGSPVAQDPPPQARTRVEARGRYLRTDRDSYARFRLPLYIGVLALMVPYITLAIVFANL